VPAGSAPTAAGQRRASAPSGDLQADGRVSFADIVRLGHLNSARGRPPPSYQPKRAFTAPRSNCAVRGLLPPPPATDRRSPLRSLDGLTSPAARTAPVPPRRTAFGDSTLDATTFHGEAEASRIQAGHPPRRSRPSIKLL
jgi:hypothetical protein